MVVPSHLKTSYSLHVSSMKPPSSSSTLTSLKLKTLLHTLILSNLCRVDRALSKAKSILIQVFKEIQLIEPLKNKNKNKNKHKLFFGSFRLHYNWCSSHVVPAPPSPSLADQFPTSRDDYYDSTWNSVISMECEDDVAESQLSGYLRWLEEKKVSQNCGGDHQVNEIDKLADKFIESCHEKFRLEKQESYRRFQEMMARSV